MVENILVAVMFILAASAGIWCWLVDNGKTSKKDKEDNTDNKEKFHKLNEENAEFDSNIK